MVGLAVGVGGGSRGGSGGGSLGGYVGDISIRPYFLLDTILFFFAVQTL